MSARNCESCGKLMRDNSDFPRGNFSSNYCSSCVDAGGRLLPRELIRVNMIRMRVNSKRMDESEAAELVDGTREAVEWIRSLLP